jgi:hypothetical protein
MTSIRFKAGRSGRSSVAFSSVPVRESRHDLVVGAARDFGAARGDKCGRRSAVVKMALDSSAAQAILERFDQSIIGSMCEI